MTIRDEEEKVTLTITVGRLRGLLYSEMELENLEAAGVDNWEGYEETDTIEEEQIEEALNNLVKENN